MLRLGLLSIPAVIVFAGFAAPFVLEGNGGYAVGALLIGLGSLALWHVEKRTKRSLDENSTFNAVMKAEGDNLIGGDDSGPPR